MIRPRRVLASIAVVVCAIVSAGPAWGDDPAATQESDARFKAGLSYGYQGKWERARLSFIQAYAILPTANILWNVAFAELKSGHVLDALTHFEEYERDPKAEAVHLAALPMFRERAFKQIGRIKVEAAPGATVWVDGSVVQDSSKVINVAPGAHTVKVQVGMASEERRVTLSAGQVDNLSFALREPTKEPALPEQGLPSPAVPPLATASSASPQIAESPPPSSAAPSPKLTWGWIGAGATAAALGVGISFALAAHTNKRDAEAALATTGTSLIGCSHDNAPAACGDARDAASRHDRYNELAAVGFVVAGILGVTTAGYLFFASRPRGKISVSPAMSAHQTGLTVQGAF